MGSHDKQAHSFQEEQDSGEEEDDHRCETLIRTDVKISRRKWDDSTKIRLVKEVLGGKKTKRSGQTEPPPSEVATSLAGRIKDACPNSVNISILEEQPKYNCDAAADCVSRKMGVTFQDDSKNVVNTSFLEEQ